MYTVLAVDHLYYKAAQDSLARARKALPALARQRKRHQKLQDAFDAMDEERRESEDPRLHANELHDLAITMESEDYTLGERHAPLIQECASVHILCSASLEAHVNYQAERALPKAEWEQFERLSLEAKWLLLPRLLGLTPFNPGVEPYQGFVNLVRYRNALVHYKTKREEWVPPGIPSFLRKLGLDEDAAERSMKAAAGMIGELAVQLGEGRPRWLDRPGGNFFTFDSEGKSKDNPV